MAETKTFSRNTLIKLFNAGWLRARNNADDGDVNILKVDTSDDIILGDAANDTNVDVQSGDGSITLDSSATGGIAIDATSGAAAPAAGIVKVDGVGFSIDAGGTSSNVTNTAGDLTVSTVTSGAIAITSATTIANTCTGFDVIASADIAIDGVGASNFTIDTGNLTISTTTSGLLILNGVGGVTVDSAATISVDGVGNSNITIDTGNLTINTTTSGNVIINGVGGVTLDSAAAVSIDAAGASNFTVASANLTLETSTTGNVILKTTTAGDVVVLDFRIATASNWPSAGVPFTDSVETDLDFSANSVTDALNQAYNNGGIGTGSILGIQINTLGTGATDYTVDFTDGGLALHCQWTAFRKSTATFTDSATIEYDMMVYVDGALMAAGTSWDYFCPSDSKLEFPDGRFGVGSIIHLVSTAATVVVA